MASLTTITYKRSTLYIHTYDFLKIITSIIAYSALGTSVSVTPFAVTSLSLVADMSVLEDIRVVEQIMFSMVSVKLDFLGYDRKGIVYS